MSEPVEMLMFECINCGQMAMADPELVMSIDVRRGPNGEPVQKPGEKNPLCESCARTKVRLHKERGWPVPAMFDDPTYWSKAYYRE
jgi:hypothetical protein